MFITPVPWLSFVQEREERGFGLAQGGDRRRSRLSHRLIALVTLFAVYKLPPTRTRVSAWHLWLRVDSHKALASLVATFCVLTQTATSTCTLLTDFLVDSHKNDS